MLKKLFALTSIVIISLLTLQGCTDLVVDDLEAEAKTYNIMVPEDANEYSKEMERFIQEGGENPLDTTKFVEKEIEISDTSDVVKASAQAAAEEIAPSGGPEKASISYLEIKNDIAYVLLDIDLDGWAGSSVSTAKIHPLVEKTLLQFSEINEVVFDYAEETN